MQRRDEGTDADVRILYLADIRFPLERANGIQTMETCHALASRGHDVTLLVRPDTRHAAARSVRLLRPAAELDAAHRARAGRRARARRVAPATSPSRSARALGRARQDLIFTRDLGLASLLLRLPRRAARAGRLRSARHRRRRRRGAADAA